MGRRAQIVDSRAYLSGVQFHDNRGTTGGALHAVRSWVLVEGGVFAGNAAARYGGAVAASSSWLTLRAAALRGNVAPAGAALMAMPHAGMCVTLRI